MKNFLESRNQTIDLLRALTMAMMLMVNDFWSVEGIPHWMHHAEWGEDMLGFSDLVFPTFLFCVGMSIPYAIAAMRRKGKTEGDVIKHIIERSFALVLMGAFICNYEEGIDPNVGYDRNVYSILMTVAFFLVYNHYKSRKNFVKGLKICGCAILIFLLVTSRSPEGRTFYPYWWGILGLIGWAYLFCALVYTMTSRTSTRIAVWAILFCICLFCSETADYSAFAGKPIFSQESPNIVELILSNLHIGNASNHLLVMSGVIFSAYYLKYAHKLQNSKRVTYALAIAAICAIVGALSHQLFITSKLIGTLPWIFYTLAIDVVLYVLIDAVVAIGKAGIMNCLKPAGTATLTCYMVPYILYPIVSLTVGWGWSYAIPSPFGIVKCLAFSALCISITWVLAKATVKLKI